MPTGKKTRPIISIAVDGIDVAVLVKHEKLSCLCAQAVLEFDDALNHLSLLFSRDHSAPSFCPTKKLGIRQGEASACVISTSRMMQSFGQGQGSHGSGSIPFSGKATRAVCNRHRQSRQTEVPINHAALRLMELRTWLRKLRADRLSDGLAETVIVQTLPSIS
jgi:hypothetical protein